MAENLVFILCSTAKLNCFTQSYSVGENKSLTKPPGPLCDLPRVYTVTLCKLITQSWSISSSCLTCYEKNLGWTQKVKLLENKECKGKELFSTQLLRSGLFPIEWWDLSK